MAEWRSLIPEKQVCSLRGCGSKPTERLDLSSVGLRRFKKKGFGEWEPNLHKVELVLCSSCFHKVTSRTPVDLDMLEFVTEFVYGAADKLKSETVPVGEALEEFIVEEVRLLAIQWKSGNKDYVADRLEQLPSKVAFAVLAALCAQSIGLHDYLRKRI